MTRYPATRASGNGVEIAGTTQFGVEQDDAPTDRAGRNLPVGNRHRLAKGSGAPHKLPAIDS